MTTAAKKALMKLETDVQECWYKNENRQGQDVQNQLIQLGRMFGHSPSSDPEEGMLNKYPMSSDDKQKIKKPKKLLSDGSLNDLLYQTSQGQHCQHVTASDRAKSSSLAQFWAAEHSFQKTSGTALHNPIWCISRLSTQAFKWTWDQDKEISVTA